MNKAMIVTPFEANKGHFELAVNEYEYPRENVLKWLQDAVGGGYVEHFTLDRYLYNVGIDSFINDEGKMRDFEPTFALCDRDYRLLDVIVGPVVFTGIEDDDTTGMNDEQVRLFYLWLDGLKTCTLKDEKGLHKCYVLTFG